MLCRLDHTRLINLVFAWGLGFVYQRHCFVSGILIFTARNSSCKKVFNFHRGCVTDTPLGRHPPPPGRHPPRQTPSPSGTATEAGSSHPTGMHSGFNVTCKHHHLTSLNPFLNCVKKGDVDSKCKLTLSLKTNPKIKPKN